MMKSVWTAVFSVGVSSCFAMADESQPIAPNQAGKVIDLYNQYMDSADWHMAELIALGAREKFGEDEPLIQRMLSEVEKAKATTTLEAPEFKLPIPQPESQRYYVTAYEIGDLVSGTPSEEVATNEIVTKARYVVGEGLGSESSVALYASKKTLIVQTSQEKHDSLKAMMQNLRAEKKPEVAPVPAPVPAPAPAVDVELVVTTYSIGEIISKAKSEQAAAEKLERAVRSLIGADQESGSSVTLSTTDMTLVVTTTPEKHLRLQESLQQLKATN